MKTSEENKELKKRRAIYIKTRCEGKKNLPQMFIWLSNELYLSIKTIEKDYYSPIE